MVEIDTNQNKELVYELDNLQLENCNLIISDEQAYFETSDANFPFINLTDFVLMGEDFGLVNEDKDIFKLNKEQFGVIKELLIELGRG